MSESDRGNPIQAAIVVLLLVGGGWYFLRHYEIEGLDEVSISPRVDTEDVSAFVSYQNEPITLGSAPILKDSTESTRPENPFQGRRSLITTGVPTPPSSTQRVPASVRVASWALDGFGPTKFSNPIAQQNLARIVRQYDIVALQQISSIERDLVSRLVEVINHGEGRYDYVLGNATGPTERPEQLAFIFDTTRVRVDRQQTYTIHDPNDHLTFDPLVAWFRAAEAPVEQAWTFTLVNVRIDLAKAPSEVGLLKGIMEAIRKDGRGEDDVVMVGLFQADDAYLLPTLGGAPIAAAVRHRPTDVFGKYQTSNILFNTELTSEFVGRGGVVDYPRLYNLNTTQAETVSSHLPVYATFSAFEGVHAVP